jgi:hypothetical protein
MEKCDCCPAIAAFNLTLRKLHMPVESAPYTYQQLCEDCVMNKAPSLLTLLYPTRKKPTMDTIIEDAQEEV